MGTTPVIAVGTPVGRPAQLGTYKKPPVAVVPRALELLPTMMLPAELMVSRVLGEDAPSAVVANEMRPGISLVPGVPSASTMILAAVLCVVVVSWPEMSRLKSTSPLTTAAGDAWVPRERTAEKFGA
jgi:hypothetical protein